MNLWLLFKLVVVAVIFAPFVSLAETNIEACSPSNSNIDIDAQIPGVISTPAFPDGYADSTCIWKIQAPNNFRLSITIEVLRLQGVDDHLVIRDGASPLTPMIGKYGPCASGSVTLFSSGNSAFLQMVSAVFNLKDQLRISYRPTDPDDIDCSNQAENAPNFCSSNTKLTESSGVLSSPKFPNNYDADEYCLWSIVAPQGYRVQVNIQWFGIESHRYSRPGTCGDDKLSISEHRGNNTKDIKTLCGCQELFSHVSHNEKMWLTFTSYKKANWPGFYVTYQTIAPDECPAGNTSCPTKSMAPVGFNAQGQVCSASVKTSTQVIAPTSTFSLRPRSAVESLAKTSGRTMENSTRVTSPFRTPLLEASHVRSSAKKSIQAQKTSTQGAKPTGTFFLVPSIPGTHRALVTKTSVLSPFLKTSHITSSARQRLVLDTSTLVVLPLEASSLLASSATSSDNTATTESTESTSLQPMTDVSNTLIYATKQTGILKPATSSLNWGISIKDISGTSLVEVKDRKTVAPVAQLKHSRNISWSVRSSIASRKIYETATSVTEATKHEEASRVTDRKSDGIKPSISSGSKSDQSSILVVRSTYTGLIRETSSLAQSNHVISQTTHVTPATQSEIIQPTKASVESKEISSLTQITQVEKTTTKEPPDTTEEPDVQVTEGKDSPPPGVTIKCTPYAMEIIISRVIIEPELYISSLHLQDSSCKVIFSNDTHALLRAPLESCDTEQTISQDYFIYSNSIVGDAKSSSSNLITREGRIKFAFQCSYRRIHVISIAWYSPRKKEVRTSVANGTGKFTYEMDMFKDSKYDVVVNQYPVNVHPGQTLYLQIDVKSRDQSLLAFLEECWVTPTKDPLDQTRYTIIEYGCPRDSTLKYIYKKSSTQKFTFKAFKFRNVSSLRMHVHCDVVTCRSSDTGSVCDKGCAERKRLRRENKPYIMDKDVFLSLGPVNFEEETAESHKSIVYIKALAGLLGVLSIVLLTAIVIVILRRRKRHKNTWIFLSSRTQSMQDETSSKLMTTEL